MNNPRKPYRVELEASNPVEGVFTHLYRGKVSVTGRVTEVAAEGVSLAAPEGQLALLRNGDLGTLVLRAQWIKTPYEFAVKVVDKDPDVAQPRIQLQFTQPDQIDSAVSPILHSIFNRRQAPRVRPHEGETVEVTLAPLTRVGDGDKRLTGTLTEISSVGLQVSVPGLNVQGLETGKQLALTLSLSGRVFELIGTVRNCLQGARSGSLGLEFDADATPDYQRIQGAILGYVLGRLHVSS